MATTASIRRARAALFLAPLLTAALGATAHAASIGMGTDASFSVLGGSTVTNTGPSVLAADLGVSPGTALPGFSSATIGGAVHANDAVAAQAQVDLVTAYNDAAGRPTSANVSADLGGSRLDPGVYTSASSLGLTGQLTLDAHGDPNAVFVFQAGSTLITASNSSVLLVGSAQGCNVFWQVGSSATLGTNTHFNGTIMALTSIALQTGATLEGRALARNGAVTLDDNVITKSTCSTTPDTTGGTPGTTTTPGTPGTTTGASGAPTPPEGTKTTTAAGVTTTVTTTNGVTTTTKTSTKNGVKTTTKTKTKNGVTTTTTTRKRKSGKTTTTVRHHRVRKAPRVPTPSPARPPRSKKPPGFTG
jgi:hypothetical protein